MYEKVRIEMAKRNLSIIDIAKCTGMNRDTLSRKLSRRTRLNLDEAFNIQRAVFPDIPIRVLFEEDADNTG
ncbi:MAG: helix-turn-helix transcriptional regulator [Lachnospiraceae bacterium]|nr:helix-turn-helix transcriptional regulator [Lachnospiraceae bacterium]MCM1239993.1 helix-turn-helix transcriptional regulator [Lachnospiraceae bacterium]